MRSDNDELLDIHSGSTVVTSPSAGRRLFKNAAYNSGSWGITVLVTLVATPYIVRQLSVEGYGIYALLTGLVGYYGLLDLGLGQGVIKFVAEYKARGDDVGICRSINAALWVQIVTGLIGSGVLILLSEPILGLLKVSPDYWADAQAGLRASAVGFLLTMITGTFSSVLMGLQRYDVTGKVGAITNVALTMGIIGLLLAGYGLKEVLYATAFSSLVVFAVYFAIVRRNVPEWKLSLVFDKVHFARLFKFSGYMFIIRASSLFNNYIVRFIVGAVAGPAAVTYYTVPMKVISAFGGFLGNVTTVLFPFASALSVEANKERLKSAYLRATRYSVAIAFPGYLILAFFSRESLTIWMGQDFASHSWLVMSLLCVAYLLSALTMVPVNFTLGLGKSNIIAVFSTIVLVFGITLVIPLALVWGVEGAAAGLLLDTLQGLVLTVYVTKSIVEVSLGVLFREVFRFHLSALLVCAFAFTLVKSVFPLTSAPYLVMCVLTILAVYVGVYVKTHPASYKEIVGLLHGRV